MKLTVRLILFSFCMLAMTLSCGNPVTTVAEDGSPASVPAPWDLVEEGEEPSPTRHSYDLAPDSAETADSAAADNASTEEDSDENAMPDMPPADLSPFLAMGRLNEVFNDSNKYQYAAAEKIGIKPISSLPEAYFTKRPLVKVESSGLYTVEELTHSMPYLVPEAAKLLETIGRNFRDSLHSKKKGAHRFRITSLLRSAQSVKKLRRVNRNATDSSTHQLGTTFDISWSRFDHDPESAPINDAELKYVLAEVLRDLRAAGKCLVKYEVKSPCFHITATGL